MKNEALEIMLKVIVTGDDKHVFRAGESFAEAALAENTGYSADALALEQTSVLLVPKAPFLELLQKHSELALRMLGSMSRHLQALVGLIDDLTLKDVQTRFVCWLLKRCGKPFGRRSRRRGTRPDKRRPRR
jgi:CRP/FNR family transcriptional regulator, dissimilatory nitrate respiration regulator